jgi:hypothetical protein
LDLRDEVDRLTLLGAEPNEFEPYSESENAKC